MTPEKAKRIQQLSTEIASLLYGEVDAKGMTNLMNIEKTARDLILEHVTPNIGIFLSKRAQIRMQEGLEE
ncbi:MAG: hypothetical protein LH649_01670 [Pseudanabaena sp. CAN_BIN31]|nr:hypothetical protein [Pseudanabaena sp. CAN_BIN31]